jgi:uncharacterized protein
MNPVSRFITGILLGLIRLYQRLISPLLGPSCRFQPTCSNYATECLSTHGPLRGTWLAVRRIARCHPFHPGGYDPPPQAGTARNSHPSHLSPRDD